MKLIRSISYALFNLLLLAGLGCDPPAGPDGPGRLNGSFETPTCALYAPERIDILPLTEFKDGKQGGEPRLEVYVSLLDSAGSQIKFPVKCRFELYEQVKRSAKPKGKRVAIWPQTNAGEPNEPPSHWFDLEDLSENSLAWHDFVRAYRFTLPFRPQPAVSYILEVTCLRHDARRLTAEVALGPKQ